MYYRELGRQDVIAFRVLQDTVVRSLQRRDFWTPIKSDERLFFDQVWTYFQGCFGNDGKLIAVSGLFLNPKDCAYDAYEIGLDPDTTAVISRTMVLAPFRGKQIALKMNDRLLMRAQAFGGKKDVILATHPDNLPMNLSAVKLGMKVETRYLEKVPPVVYYRMKI